MKTVTLAIAAALLAAPAFAQAPAPVDPANFPVCGGKIQDSCVQSKTEHRAMTGEQADARDARNGGQWTPNNRATTTTTTTKTTTSNPQ